MCRETSNLTLFVILIYVISVSSFIYKCNAQELRIDYIGTIEFPSQKCVMNRLQFLIDWAARRLCFCVQVKYTVPAWTCIEADAKITMEYLSSLKTVFDTIKTLIPGSGKSINQMNAMELFNTNLKSIYPNWPGSNMNIPFVEDLTRTTKGKEGGKSRSSSKSQSKTTEQQNPALPFITPFLNL